MSTSSKRKREEGEKQFKKLRKEVSEKIVTDLAKCLTDESFSDFNIVCVGPGGRTRTFKVHRSVICMHSKYFERACRTDFAESQSREITLYDDDLDAVETMINYFYKYDIPYNMYATPVNLADALKLILTYSVADKYQVPGLKSVVFEALKITINSAEICENPVSMEVLSAMIYDLPLANIEHCLKDLLLHAWVANGRHLSNGPPAKATLKNLLGCCPDFFLDLAVEALSSQK